MTLAEFFLLAAGIAVSVWAVGVVAGLALVGYVFITIIKRFR
jgi:hypothetical protein